MLYIVHNYIKLIYKLTALARWLHEGLDSLAIIVHAINIHHIVAYGAGAFTSVHHLHIRTQCTERSPF